MQEVETECYEIDGKDYLIGKKTVYNNSTYILLVNKDDYTDSLVQKEVGDTLEPVENIEILHNVLSLMKDNK